ncbi:MAG: peptidylprolyl isomerase [Sphingomonadales bacterium]|nr:peptidylprolyl isomerase [Sphingomonadales bacterium]NCO50446.1 peptidylprolyl isomerase [Sphingomonadales bacterium]NCP27399.1 peptidylprolyl isomerase [Sphingomonadales bacterium]NCP42464.1 peptidylprolyl isomerase [Sphingomonadales bacterium]NCP48810.1 peptidylprolyl isomerase [Sphingomonadales bacterium]
MNRLISIASLAALAIAAPLAAQETGKPEFPSPHAIVEQAPPEEWIAIAPSDLLVMDLAADADGDPRRVVIQLMPEPFSQGWIRNIRKLAAAHWWDGTSINRVQDNYVAQWGDASEEKALPGGLETVPESEYEIEATAGKQGDIILWHPKNQLTDSYADWTWFESGWPLAQEIGDGTRTLSRWPVHCYGAVGVGRNYSPDTGSGAELYTVIGHAPRHLDRNIAVVGRVIEGIEHLSSLPRGKGQLGFYEDASKRVSITSIRLASELPTADQPRFEYLSTEGETFAKYADARANRRDPFFNVPAGGADICNIPVPVRRVKAE